MEARIRPEDVKRLEDDGVTVVLHLDISSEEYVRAGEPWRDIVVACNPELSSYLFQRTLDAIERGEVAELRDNASQAYWWLACAGRDWRAALAQLLDVFGSGSPGRNLMAGFADRVDAADAERDDERGRS